MKHIFMIMAALLFMSTPFAAANAGRGPAPNSGDCIPDGSGWPTPAGPYGPGPGR